MPVRPRRPAGRRPAAVAGARSRPVAGGTLDRADRSPPVGPGRRPPTVGGEDLCPPPVAPGPRVLRGGRRSRGTPSLLGVRPVRRVTMLAMGIPLYRQWGQLAIGPYAVCRRLHGRGGLAGRAVAPPEPAAADAGGAAEAPSGSGPGSPACPVALVGATVVPLALEVVWASEGNAALHVQPEVLVVERAGARGARGRIRTRWSTGTATSSSTTRPAHLRAVLPVPPGMVLFGFSSGSQGGGPPHRCPDPIPGLHRGGGPDRPQPAPPVHRRPVPGPAGADRAAVGRPPAGHRGDDMPVVAPTPVEGVRGGSSRIRTGRRGRARPARVLVHRVHGGCCVSGGEVAGSSRTGGGSPAARPRHRAMAPAARRTPRSAHTPSGFRLYPPVVSSDSAADELAAGSRAPSVPPHEGHAWPLRRGRRAARNDDNWRRRCQLATGASAQIADSRAPATCGGTSGI